jgi:hypothetical protein
MTSANWMIHGNSEPGSQSVGRAMPNEPAGKTLSMVDRIVNAIAKADGGAEADSGVSLWPTLNRWPSRPRS